MFWQNKPDLDDVILEENGQSLVVKVRISKRASSIRIKINKSAYSAELVVPRPRLVAKAREFLLSKKRWVFAHLVSANRKQIKFEEGAVIPILGMEYAICSGTKSTKGESIYLDKNRLIFADISKITPVKARVFLTHLLLQEIHSYAPNISQQLGIEPSSIAIKNFTSKWGSCSMKGSIVFSWRLIFAPINVLHYVIIHEFCHLREHNHQKRFWDLVASLCPDYKTPLKWLKKNGHSLFFY